MTENNAIAGQNRDVAGLLSENNGTVIRAVFAVLVAPEDEALLEFGVLFIAAVGGYDEFIDAVVVEVADGDGYGHWHIELKHLDDLAGAVGGVELNFFAGGEGEALSALENYGLEKSGGFDLLFHFAGHGLGFLGIEDFVCGQFGQHGESFGGDAVGGAPVHGGFGFAGFADDKFIDAVGIEVDGGHLIGFDGEVGEALPFDPEGGLVKDSYGFVERHGESERWSFAVVEFAGGAGFGPGGGDTDMIFLAVRFLAAEVDIGGGERHCHIVITADDDITESLAGEVGDATGDGTLAGEGSGAFTVERINVRRCGLVMVLAVGENEIEVAVVVKIVLIDTLKNPGPGYVEIVSAVAESSAPECVESRSCPGFFCSLLGHFLNILGFYGVVMKRPCSTEIAAPLVIDIVYGWKCRKSSCFS